MPIATGIANVSNVMATSRYSILSTDSGQVFLSTSYSVLNNVMLCFVLFLNGLV